MSNALGIRPSVAGLSCNGRPSHPLGATGAMITGIVLDELERTGKSTGLITLCAANGLGTATIIERV